MRSIPSSNTIGDRERDRGHRRCDVALGDAPVAKMHLDRTLVSADAGDWLALDGDVARPDPARPAVPWVGMNPDYAEIARKRLSAAREQLELGV